MSTGKTAPSLGAPDAEILAVVVERVVQAVQPRRLVLFGSAARGEMGPHSDLDLLVIMADGVHRRETEHEVFRCLMGLGLAKDIVVATETDISEYGDNPSLVLFPALREGRELYRAAE